MAEFCNELVMQRKKYPADGSSGKDLQCIGNNNKQYYFYRSSC
jgi:hypothetical protein